MGKLMHRPAVGSQRPIQDQVRFDPWVSKQGFTLVELMLALGLGLLVAAWVIEAMLAHGNFSAKLVDRLHQREFERRARRLIEDDRRLAILASSQPGSQATACNLAGRKPCCICNCPPANQQSPGASGRRHRPSGAARC